MHRFLIALLGCIAFSAAYAQGLGRTPFGFNGEGFGLAGFQQYSTGTSSAAMKTPVMASALLPTSGSVSPEFVPIIGSTAVAATAPTAIRAIPIPFSGTVKGLYTNLPAVQTNASVVDYINGSVGTVGCAYTPSTAPFECDDTTHSDSVSAGDLLQWRFSLSTGSWAQTPTASQISFIAQAVSGQQGMLVAGTNNANAVNGSVQNNFIGLGAAGAINTTTELNVSSIMPTAGQIAAIYVTNNGTAENTSPHSYQVWKNGVATSLSCNMVASSAVGCCANLTGTGTVGAPGSTANCITGTSVSVTAGDTISVDAVCSTAPGTPCSNAIPGISLLWLPTTAGQAVITSSTLPNISNPFLGFSDNLVHSTVPLAIQIAPYIGSSTLTFSNLLYCTKTNPGGTASRVVTSQSSSAPNVTPVNVSGGTVAIASVANGACPGANSAVLLGGNQDNTHTWTAPSGASLVNSQADLGGPAGGVQAMKYSYVASLSPSIAIPSWVPSGAQMFVDFPNNRAWDGIAGVATTPAALLSDTRAATVPYDPGTSITTSVAANTLPIGSAGLQVFQNNVNYLKSTQGDYTATGWVRSNLTAALPTVTKNPFFGTSGCTAADTAPDGSCNTSEITFPATTGGTQETVVQQQSATLVTGGTYTCSMWIKNSAATANPQLYLSILEGASPFSEIARTLVQPGATWQKYSVTFVVPATFTSAWCEIGNTTPGALNAQQGILGGGTIEAWVSELTPGSEPGPYVPTTTSAATTIALDNITATGDLATALASSSAALAVTTHNAGSGLARTEVDANGTVLLGLSTTDQVTTALSAVLSSKAIGNFESTEQAYLSWNGSGGSINLNGTAITTDATARTTSGPFHIGATSGTSAPLNGYINTIAVYPTATTPPLVASAPITGVSITSVASLASGTFGAPSTIVEGDTWMPTEDASNNVFLFSNDSGWGSFGASGGNGNVILSQATFTAGTPGFITQGNITGGPPGVVNSFSPQPIGNFATQQSGTQNTWKSCGLIAVKDGATDTDLLGGLVWQLNPTTNPWTFGQQVGSIISVTEANAATSASWNGMPPTPAVLPIATPTFNSTKFAAPCFIQYAPGYINSTLPTPNPDNSSNYLYAISNDVGINTGSNIYLARIALSTFETSLGGTLAAAVTPSSWTFYNSAGCPGGDGTNSACWGVLASATPIFTQANQLGRSAMTYLPATNRYVLSSWYWPTTNGLNSGTQTELNMSNTSQMVFIDCAHPWSCTGIVSRVDWPTQGYYSEAIIPPSLAADGGYTATGIFNGNFKHAGTFSSASVYTPYMSQFTFKY